MNAVPAALLRAQALRRAGRLAEAGAACRDLLSLPRDPAALAGRGHLARRRGDEDAALALFRDAAALAPTQPGIRLELVRSLRALGQATAAEAECMAIRAFAPDHLGALLHLAELRRRRGDPRAALGPLRVAIAAHPAHAGAHAALAEALRDSGAMEEAATQARRALDLAPGLAAALAALGRILRARGERAGALALFRQALARNPESAALAVEVAQELVALDRAPQAEALLALHPAHPTALLWLGQARRRRGDRAGARAAFAASRAIGGGPRLAATLELAAEHREAGEHAAALRLLEEAPPGHPAAMLARGQVLRAAGRAAEALAVFVALEQAHPGHAQALIEQALCHRALGAPGDAEAALARLLATDPRHPGALQQRADLLWLAERADAALALCEEIVAQHPRLLQPRLDAARALAALGRLEEALAWLDAAAARLGAHPAIALRRAELLSGAGRVAEEDCVLREAVARWPAHAGLRIRRAQADLALGRFAAVEAALRRPATTAGEAGAMALIEGQLADARWHPAAALLHYAEALRRNPNQGGAEGEMARACMLRFEPDRAWRHLSAQLAKEATPRALRGGTARPSQHHLGQVLEEFRLDREALTALVALRDLPPVQRLPLLAALLRARPEHTPTAIALLLALRQAGRFERAAPRGAAAMPRRIIQYWDAAEPPADIAVLMDSWPAANPGFAHRRFDDAAARAWLRAHATPEMLRAYLRAPQPAQKADLFRLAILAEEGGWYADADDRCLAPLDALAPEGASLVLYQEEYATLGNDMIGAAPGHPVILAARDAAVAAVNRGDADLLWLSTGPGLLSRAFAAAFVADPCWFEGAAVLERWELGGRVARHCRATYKATDRHWLRAMAGSGRPA
jgi:tetratricopeptide (TPR) repeat protein